MPPKASVKFPDFLPNIRIAGPLGRSLPLSTATTHCALDLPQTAMRQKKAKVILELRVLVLINVPPTQKDKPMPQSITVASKGCTKQLANPRWTKVSGYYVNEHPVDVDFLFEAQAGGTGAKLEFDLTVDILDLPNANGVAEVFLSRQVSTSTLIRSILGADVLPRDMLEERRLNMKDSGIESEVVSLKCPCLGTRIKTPVRFEGCKHLECFDLHNFLLMEEKRPKGRCPVCNKLIEFRTLGICEFTKEIIEENENCESYRISPEGIEPLSPALASETRKRKRAALCPSVDLNTPVVDPPKPLSASNSNIQVHQAQRRRRAQPEKEIEKMKQSDVPRLPQQTLTETPNYIVID